MEANTNTSLHALIQASSKLSPVEQLQLIAAISESLYRKHSSRLIREENDVGQKTNGVSGHIVADISELVGVFWPEEESADDVNAFLYALRDEERTRDL